jgi:hypothetical protein
MKDFLNMAKQVKPAVRDSITPVSVKKIKANSFKKGGRSRKAYKKGGKVEGAVWHENDAHEPFMPHQIHGLHIVTAQTGEPIFSGRK